MMSGRDELSAPGEKLMMKRNPNRADVATRPAEATGMRKFYVSRGVEVRRQDGTDRSWDRGPIAVSAASPVDRACVETGATADASQGLAKCRSSQKLTSPVVDDHDVKFLRVLRCVMFCLGRFAGRGTRSMEMGCVGRDRLAGDGAREQAQKGGEVALLRNDLLETDAGDMQAGQRRPQIGIALVRDDDEATGVRNGEVDAGEAGFGS